MGLMFPKDLTNSNNSKFMTFRITSYVRRSISYKAITTAIPDASNTIRLPIPHELTDTQAVGWADTPLGSVVGGVLESLVATRGEDARSDAFSLEGLSQRVGQIQGSQVSDIAGTLGQGAAISLFERGTRGAPGVSPAVQQFYGIGINPFMSVSFNSPGFKTHQFSWKLIPRDPDESTELHNIIQGFRKAMLPGISNALNNNLLFEYPDMIEISLTPNEYLYNFKRCVIETMSVNYAAASAPSFFERTNAPTVVELSIRLKEIEYWTKADYGGQQAQLSSEAAGNALRREEARLVAVQRAEESRASEVIAQSQAP